MKKTMIALLILAMILSAVSCAQRKPVMPLASGSGSESEDTTSDGVTTEVTTSDNVVTSEITPPHTSEDRPPIVGFDGKSYRVLVLKGGWNEFFADERSPVGERGLIIWNRNCVVEDAYDVKLEDVVVDDLGSLYAMTNHIISTVLIDEDSFDVALNYVSATDRLMTHGVFIINLLELEHNDFSQSYWANGLNEKLILEDALYAAVGDMATSTYTDTWVTYMNCTLGETYGVTDRVLELIKNGDWTVDALTEIATGVYDDVDDVEGRSLNDVYGYAFRINAGALIDWRLSTELQPFVPDDKDTLIAALDSDAMVKLADKLLYLYGHENTFRNEPISSPVIEDGRALFWGGMVKEIYNDKKSTAGCMAIPMPKLDENQSKYLTPMTESFNAIVVPVTCEDRSFVSLMTEVLCYETHKQVVPALYKDLIPFEHRNDPIRRELLEIIFDGRNADFLQVYFPQNCYARRLFNNSAISGQTYTDTYETYREFIDLDLKAVVDAFRANKG